MKKITINLNDCDFVSFLFSKTINKSVLIKIKVDLFVSRCRNGYRDHYIYVYSCRGCVVDTRENNERGFGCPIGFRHLEQCGFSRPVSVLREQPKK